MSGPIRVKFAWYDLWIGAYIDRDSRTLYICPVPMLVIEIHLPARELERPT